MFIYCKSTNFENPVIALDQIVSFIKFPVRIFFTLKTGHSTEWCYNNDEERDAAFEKLLKTLCENYKFRDFT